MKRRPQLLIVLLLLVAGAIVNVAVAWVAPYAFGEKYQIGWADGTRSYQWSPVGGTRRGWPLPALSTEVPNSSGGSTGFAIEIGNDDGSKLELGYLPIWPGFAINTVFYAGVLWLLFAAPLALRRRRRIKRGLCPKCAYDLWGAGSDSAACPECGATVKPRPGS